MNRVKLILKKEKALIRGAGGSESKETFSPEADYIGS